MAQTLINPMHVVSASIALVDKGQAQTITAYLPSVPCVGDILNFSAMEIEGGWKVTGVAFEIHNSSDLLVCKTVQITAEQVE